MRLALACGLAVTVVACVAPTAVAAKLRPEGGDLAATVAARLNRAGEMTFPMLVSDGYFEDAPVQPRRAFQVYGGLHGSHSFTFSVAVYGSAAQAAAMYGYDRQCVRDIGGDFHAFKIIRVGRVLYMAATAPAPDPNAAPVPMKAFLALVARASARL